MSDRDSWYSFTDNQGKSFRVMAGSEGEAWSLAQTTIIAHDAEYQRGDPRVMQAQTIVNSARDNAYRQHGRRISDGALDSGLRTLPRVPTDTEMDNTAAMIGTDGGAVSGSQPRQLPGNTTVKDLLPPNTNEAWVYTQGGWRRAEHVRARELQSERKGNCLVIAACLALVVVCGWAVIYSMM